MDIFRIIKKLPFRLFYYFRIGYSTYLSLPVALFGYVTVIYQLFLKNIPSLAWLFPRFHIFIIYIITFLFPVACVLGWLHIKHSAGYRSEIDIGIEANPYCFRLTPGKEKELNYPFQLLMLDLAEKFYEKEGLLTAKEKKLLEFYRSKIVALLEGKSLSEVKK